MKYFLILFSVLAFFACTDSKTDKAAADENAVEFVNLSFEEALAKAKEMNKMVLVDFYSDG